MPARGLVARIRALELRALPRDETRVCIRWVNDGVYTVRGDAYTLEEFSARFAGSPEEQCAMLCSIGGVRLGAF